MKGGKKMRKRELNRNDKNRHKTSVIIKVLAIVFIFMAIFTFGALIGFVAGIKFSAYYYVEGLVTFFKYADVKIDANMTFNQTKLVNDMFARLDERGYFNNSTGINPNIREGVVIEDGYKLPCLDSSINTCVPRGETLSSNSPYEQEKLQNRIKNLRQQINLTAIP
jgi:hypothetical protein